MEIQGRADIIIRNGTVFDGLGNAPISADIAVLAGKIAAVQPNLAWSCETEIDARGYIVTPGFVDVHTHYDGQAIWSRRLSPSSGHGVTTAVLGNCGVGFAPCRAADHDLLLSVMEGVEDIPEIVMTEGLPWTWETFPEYLAALQAGVRDINVAAYVPHAALRVYVMGERGAAREPATPEDLQRMGELMEQALAAGALGFASASVSVHRTSSGDYTPTFGAAEEELQTIARVLRRAGRGVIQILLDTSDGPLEAMVALLERLSRTSGALVTFSLVQINTRPTAWREILELVEAANRSPGVLIRAQVFPRPIGMLLGHELSFNPFRLCPSYDAIADLPLEEKFARLRRPEIREKLLAETPADPKLPLFLMARNFDLIFPLYDPPIYEPNPADSLANRARVLNVSSESLAYDLMLEHDGRGMLLAALGNYPDGSLDATYEMLNHPHCIPGLGDGGAHYGMICDASFPTYLLTHWTRDRVGTKLPLEQVIAALTSRPARLMGFSDRGVISVGAYADLNVIDYNRLTLLQPYPRNDLPAGGRRIDQLAKGYVATLVNGEIILANDQPTGAVPGKVIREFVSDSQAA